MNENKQQGGIGFFGLLTILFIGLKLIGYINWSWVWVLSPVWLPLVIVILGFMLFIGFRLLKGIVGKRRKSRK